ncbi:MAG: ATP-dependent DNA helicase RecG [Bacteroidales bacterium]|nr:ATP-dependent DNA helicase RecG [Bacteroidales bacterium]
MANILEADIKFLPGVGPKRGELLSKELNIKTFKDLLYFFPFRYIDRSRIYTISELVPSMAYIQIRGKITSVTLAGNTPANKRLVATLKDHTGSIDLIFFKGIKWVQEKLKPGTEFIAFGKPSEFNGIINMVHPELSLTNGEAIFGGSPIMGVYSSTEKLKTNGLGNKAFAKLEYTLIEKYLSGTKETLPEYILRRKGLCPLQIALKNIHFPSNENELLRAQTRLKYEELFYLQLSLLKQKSIRTSKSNGILMKRIGDAFNKCYSALPFPLTGAQKRVIKEMRADMCSGRQMNRLLQGDVGSGKTLVALLTALIAIDNGYQACIMAPTEVLAQQHFKGISKFLEPTGVRTGLLTGSTKTKERKTLLEELKSGGLDILVGTHALIEESVEFKNLGLAIIDEQHRFGVDQRSRLWSKSPVTPHILVMTATPIPRTLAMTLYGDLDVSVIDELPPGRKPIQTIHATEAHRGKLHAFMKQQIKAGRQIFIVYPLIKESEKMDYKNLEEGYMNIIEEFKAPEYITAVVHGKQKNEDKAYDMELFAGGKAHILVATSVIEVGVDVPNASVMVIESAERFGLSQLHQLRGRVGRGSEKSYCILMTGYKLSKESRQRIDLMCQTQDGFELAEADLRMRGPGDLEGTSQSGLAMDLHIANLGRDSQIMEDSRRMAQEILDADPQLERAENALLKEQLQTLRKEGKEAKDYSQIS